ncbi:MAG: type II toxin-antitoxin system RelB/DinJ family antitoxin [Clostridia bacterium]|nr:type II toxin-antitoxin system RelB/DinJ family antitoxin [Clostridia bacterium]
MSSSVVQVRVDDASRILASRICEAMGLDLPTYLRMCIAKLNQEMKIPFTMELDEKSIVSLKAGIALDSCAARAKELGIDNMTLDEINEEIATARREADERKKAEAEESGT